MKEAVFTRPLPDEATATVIHILVEDFLLFQGATGWQWWSGAVTFLILEQQEREAATMVSSLASTLLNTL